MYHAMTKVSTKDVLMTFFGGAVLLVTMLVISFLLRPLYPLYLRQFDIGTGSIGSEALDSTPRASSIEDLRRLETFTVAMDKRDFSPYRGIALDNAAFVALYLEDGSCVAARIRYDAIQYQPFPGNEHTKLAVMPIGRWEPWVRTEKQEELLANQVHKGIFETTNYYVDMVGDFGRVRSEWDFCQDYAWAGGMLVALAFLWWERSRRVRNGESTPLVFGWRYYRNGRLSKAQTDLERWMLAACAISRISARLPIDRLGGHPRTPFDAQAVRKNLMDGWEIDSGSMCLSYVDWLLDEKKCASGKRSEIAFDGCRALSLLDTSYIAGYLTRKQMVRNAIPICQLLQRKFSGWAEFGESYLDGYKEFLEKEQRDLKNLEVRRDAFEQLRAAPNSCYQISWNLTMDARYWNDVYDWDNRPPEPQALPKKKQKATPKNPKERWFTATYAPWTVVFAGDWELIGGGAQEVESAKRALERDWGIHNRKEGLEMIEWLCNRHWNDHLPAALSWDLCRANQLLGMYFNVGYITRKELNERSTAVCKLIRQRFHSWEELQQRYLEGFAEWRAGIDHKKDSSAIRRRWEIYQDLKELPDGPYCQPWELPL